MEKFCKASTQKYMKRDWIKLTLLDSKVWKINPGGYF